VPACCCARGRLADAAVSGPAERCGFTREAVLRSHLPFKGGLRDTVMYGLLPGELG
jgi:RimJ/RimL family protein N-acetyltransferase